MTRARASLLVLCIGNPDRGDDAFGPAVAQALAHRLPKGAELRSRSGDMLALIEDWAEFDCLICVDATAPMGEPGRIHRFDLEHEELPSWPGAVSSHAFDLGQAITLARTLGLAPPTIIIYGAEGSTFDSGAPMTPGIVAAIAPAASRILAEARQLLENAPCMKPV